MWIMPKNLFLSSVFAQDCVGSKEELKELSGVLEQSLLWKSKPSSLRIWLLRWNRVFWLRALFGRTLKPSHQKNFTGKYTSLLPDIHVSHLAMPADDWERKTQGIYGHSSSNISKQLDLFSASSKTSQDTLPLDTKQSKVIWKNWAIQLRREYIVRKKSARLTFGNDSLFLRLWPTPYATMERRYKIKKGTQASDRNLCSMAIRGELTDFQPDADRHNLNGRSRELLNPAWAAQLMGTTLEKIFSAAWETQWWNKLQN